MNVIYWIIIGVLALIIFVYKLLKFLKDVNDLHDFVKKISLQNIVKTIKRHLLLVVLSVGLIILGAAYLRLVDSFNYHTIDPISISSYRTINANTPLHYEPYSSNEVAARLPEGTIINVGLRTRNSHGNTWYLTRNGYWVYSGNLILVCTHRYNNVGICVNCGAEYPIHIVMLSPSIFTVLNRYGRDETPLRTRPYRYHESFRSIADGEIVTVVGWTINSERNIWFLLDDCYWIYSGNARER